MSAGIWNIDVHCPGCRYNLRGLPMDNRCPECGRPAEAAWADGERRKSERLDAEIGERLEAEAEAAARQRRLDELIAVWEERGRRFDRLMDAAEAALRRIGQGG